MNELFEVALRWHSGDPRLQYWSTTNCCYYRLRTWIKSNTTLGRDHIIPEHKIFKSGTELTYCLDPSPIPASSPWRSTSIPLACYWGGKNYTNELFEVALRRPPPPCSTYLQPTTITTNYGSESLWCNDGTRSLSYQTGRIPEHGIFKSGTRIDILRLWIGCDDFMEVACSL